MHARMLKFTNMALLAMFGLLLLYAWGTDSITLEGERTIYTVGCKGGAWEGSRCSGELEAAERFRFRALRAHGEVLFWTVGASGPSGRYTDCKVHDGRNWRCQPGTDTHRTITLQMERGSPVPDSSGRTLAYHAVPKWKWGLVRAGLWPGHEAGG